MLRCEAEITASHCQGDVALRMPPAGLHAARGRGSGSNCEFCAPRRAAWRSRNASARTKIESALIPQLARVPLSTARAAAPARWPFICQRWPAEQVAPRRKSDTVNDRSLGRTSCHSALRQERSGHGCNHPHRRELAHAAHLGAGASAAARSGAALARPRDRGHNRPEVLSDRASRIGPALVPPPASARRPRCARTAALATDCQCCSALRAHGAPEPAADRPLAACCVLSPLSPQREQFTASESGATPRCAQGSPPRPGTLSPATPLPLVGMPDRGAGSLGTSHRAPCLEAQQAVWPVANCGSSPRPPWPASFPRAGLYPPSPLPLLACFAHEMGLVSVARALRLAPGVLLSRGPLPIMTAFRTRAF